MERQMERPQFEDEIVGHESDAIPEGNQNLVLNAEAELGRNKADLTDNRTSGPTTQSAQEPDGPSQGENQDISTTDKGKTRPIGDVDLALLAGAAPESSADAAGHETRPTEVEEAVNGQQNTKVSAEVSEDHTLPEEAPVVHLAPAFLHVEEIERPADAPPEEALVGLPAPASLHAEDIERPAEPALHAEGTIYVKDYLEIPDKVYFQWKEEWKRLLRSKLKNLGLGFTSSEIHMLSNTPTGAFIPTIVIICRSSGAREKIRKSLKNRKGFFGWRNRASRTALLQRQILSKLLQKDTAGGEQRTTTACFPSRNENHRWRKKS